MTKPTVRKLTKMIMTMNKNNNNNYSKKKTCNNRTIKPTNQKTTMHSKSKHRSETATRHNDPGHRATAGTGREKRGGRQGAARSHRGTSSLRLGLLEPTKYKDREFDWLTATETEDGQSVRAWEWAG